ARSRARAAGPEHDFRLETRQTSRWKLELIQDHGPFEGLVYFPRPPDDPGQRILSCEVVAQCGERTIAASPATDLGPLKKPLLKLTLEESEAFRAVVRISVQFYAAALVQGRAQSAPKQLSDLERREYLNDGWPTDAARQWFRAWLEQNGIVRKESERDLD